MKCILCEHSDLNKFYSDEYFQCKECSLVFKEPKLRLSYALEKEQYDFHQNDPEDMNYRKFLSQLLDPLSSNLNPGSFGLDFGCGPGPTLNIMLEELGHTVNLYDPIYFKEEKNLDQKYDFITSSEVFEHLYSPKDEFKKLISCLRPNGIIAIMTSFLVDESKFKNWHYRNDPTHISFYSKETFNWLSKKYFFSVDFYGHNVSILKF